MTYPTLGALETDGDMEQPDAQGAGTWKRNVSFARGLSVLAPSQQSRTKGFAACKEGQAPLQPIPGSFRLTRKVACIVLTPKIVVR